MAKKTTAKTHSKTSDSPKSKSLVFNHKHKIIVGGFLILLSVALLFALISFFFNWKADQSVVWTWSERAQLPGNILSKFGALAGHLLVYRGLGIAAFIPIILLGRTGLHLFLNIPLSKLTKTWFWGLVTTLWLTVFFGFFSSFNPLLGGITGYELNLYLSAFIGKLGIILLLAFVFIAYVVFRFDWNPGKTLEKVNQKWAEKNTADENLTSVSPDETAQTDDYQDSSNGSVLKWPSDELKPTISKHSDLSKPDVTEELAVELNYTENEEDNTEQDIPLETHTALKEKEYDENLSEKLLKDFGAFDPTLELSNYKFPPLDLLRDHSAGGGITINQEELEAYKNKIIDTLRNYKIEIAQIKATIGPTVTLYEIVPEAGIRISKIKNLEDDIALSLAALGIRIIAPMPGKGTIGIEVPNQNPTVVSMRSVIASQRFQKAEMELPMALGKTISNETYVVDLVKMPHMLLAGATGQGKSVGLNAILTSLLYKKHPAEIKFVLVDPKKVELSLYSKIERHFLAKLPDAEEAIITDNTKVIHTLNSLTIEMDARYELLKDAQVKDIREYNQKFKNRKLNPNDGHRFLPYIVLVIDEFADLIMTAGKEVEMPIARLAQMARAIGIHMIIATQRPSVNVITGIIKANFPARIAFRVTSKIDSRTILDGPGADQLIGRGDMLFNQGSSIIRLQCAFVDTPEIDKITEFIGSQRAYPEAYLLPEYVGEESGTGIDMDISERDPLFRDAAEVVVSAQQGSASLLQRKLKLGYNRAGRLIDQLEAAGIVGPFEGSKARQVMFNDLVSLQKFLDNEQNH